MQHLLHSFFLKNNSGVPDFDKIIRRKGVCLIWVMKLIVYIDTAIALSFMVNGFLLWLPGRLLRVKTKLYRRLLGAILGVLYSGLCFIFDFYQLWMSLLVAYMQIWAVYPEKHISLFCTYLLTAMILSGWQYMFSAQGSLALILFVLGGVALLFVAKKLFMYVRADKMYRNVTVCVGGKYVEITGYIDSGNRLPVAVVDAETAMSLVGAENVLDMKNLRQSENFRYRLVPCNTVSGEGLIPVFRPDAFMIDGMKSDVQIGVNFMPMQEKMLLPKKVLEVL